MRMTSIFRACVACALAIGSECAGQASVGVVPLRVTDPQRVVASGSVLAVAGHEGPTTQIELFDISDPCTPVSRALLTGLPRGRIAMGNGTLVLAPEGDTLTLIDVTLPHAPRFAGTINLHATIQGSPQDETIVRDLSARGSDLYVIAAYGEDRFGNFGAIHRLSLGGGAAAWSDWGLIGSPARFRDLYLVGDLAVCTDQLNGSGIFAQQDNVFFRLRDAGPPEFLRWVSTFGCGPSSAIPGGPTISVPFAGSMHRIALSQGICGTPLGLGATSDGIHFVGNDTLIASGQRLYRASGESVSLVTELPIGDRAIEAYQDVVYAVDGVSLYTYSTRCTRDVSWAAPLSGPFSEATRWNPISVPSVSSRLIFDQPGKFSVTLGSSVEVRGLEIRQGEPALIGPQFSVSIGESVELLGGTLVVANPTNADVFSATTLRADGVNGTSGALPDPERFDLILERGGRWEPDLLPAITVGRGSRVKLHPTLGPFISGLPSTPTIGGQRVVVASGVRDPRSPGAARPGLLAASSGAIDGDLINGGDLRLIPLADGTAGTLRVRGSYEQTADGVIEVEVGNGSEVLLDVDGDVILQGALRIRVREGLEAMPGLYIPLIRAEAINSEFLSGFARIEGVLNTGNPDVFWGVDFDRSVDGEHVVALVALRVPTRVAADGDESPYRETSAKNLVLISHGTASDAGPGTRFHEIAQGMAEIALRNADQADFDIVTLRWSEFATDRLERSVGWCIARNAFANVLATSKDSRRRSFNPYESARFAIQYAASVHRYFASESDPATQWPSGGPKMRIEVGSMQSIHAIGHSSGTYAANALIEILTDARNSPFGGDRPAIRHLTALDAYLPPQTGGTIFAIPSCRSWGLGWTGPALGQMGAGTTQADHYFITDEAAGTNNESGDRMRSAVINFDISGYVKGRFDLFGHGLPIDFYYDSIRHQLGRPPILESVAGVNRSLVFENYGVVFAPLMRADRRSRGREVEAARQGISASEYDDGDIDVVVIERTIAKRQRLLERGAVNTYGTDVSRRENGSLFMRSGAPAVATISGALELPANAIELRFGTPNSVDGRVTVEVGGRLVAGSDLEALSEQVGDRVLGPILIEPRSGGAVDVTVRIERSGSDTVEVELLDVSFLALEDAPVQSRLTAGSAISAAATGESVLMATYVGTDGAVVAFELDPRTDIWTELSLNELGSVDVTPVGVLALEDDGATRTPLAVLGREGVFLVDREEAGATRNLTVELSGSGATPILQGGLTFASRDGVVFIAGLDASGDLVLYWQPGQRAVGDQAWSFTNLDREHFGPQGLVRPRWTGETVSFVTDWNGLNVVGIDLAGQVWSAWWAPGLPLWRIDNLSEITRSGPIAGGLSAYTTPWGGTNIVGLDSSGAVNVIWWVPQFGSDWRVNDLSQQLGHGGLSLGGLSSYVTPWGGTNIAGVDSGGDLVVYWWAPGLDRWVVSPLSAVADQAELPIRSVQGIASPDGTISLFGFGDDHQLLRYFWSPKSIWRSEKVGGAR